MLLMELNSDSVGNKDSSKPHQLILYYFLSQIIVKAANEITFKQNKRKRYNQRLNNCQTFEIRTLHSI